MTSTQAWLTIFSVRVETVAEAQRLMIGRDM